MITCLGFYRLGDDGKNISVLKLDVEGEELQSLPQMLTSNMFENIRQLHLEVIESRICGNVNLFI